MNVGELVTEGMPSTKKNGGRKEFCSLPEVRKTENDGMLLEKRTEL